MIKTITEQERKQEFDDTLNRVKAELLKINSYSMNSNPKLTQDLEYIQSFCNKQYYEKIFELSQSIIDWLTLNVNSNSNYWDFQNLVDYYYSIVRKTIKYYSDSQKDKILNNFTCCLLDEAYPYKKYSQFARLLPTQAENKIFDYLKIFYLSVSSEKYIPSYTFYTEVTPIFEIIKGLDKQNKLTQLNEICEQLDSLFNLLSSSYTSRDYLRKYQLTNQSTVDKFNSTKNLKLTLQARETQNKEKKEILDQSDGTHTYYLSKSKLTQQEINEAKILYREFVKQEKFEQVREFLEIHYKNFQDQQGYSWFNSIISHIKDPVKLCECYSNYSSPPGILVTINQVLLKEIKSK